MSAAALVTILVTAGVYMVMQRGLVRVTFGLVLLAHAANVVILAAGGMERRGPAFVGRVPAGEAADPLPQAFALTAIVIAFALTVYLLALAGHGGEDDGPDLSAEPSDHGPDAGTVVDQAPPDPGAATGASLGDKPTGDQPTGRTVGREHA